MDDIRDTGCILSSCRRRRKIHHASPQDRIIAAQGANPRIDGGHAEPVNQEIGCDIVALRNHEFNQFPYSAGRAGGQFLQQTGTGDPIRFGEGKDRIGQELCGFHLFKGFHHDEEFDEAG